MAREVGVAATSIYLHFESVTELVDEVKRCRFGDPQAQLRAAADAAGDGPVARVRARARAYLRHGAEHPGDYAVLFTAKLVTDPAAARPAIGLAALEDLEVDLRAVLAARDGDDQDAGHVRAEAARHGDAAHAPTAHGVAGARRPGRRPGGPPARPPPLTAGRPRQ
ncbi:MAG: hypothetical protein ACXV1K_06360 [Kineosporiaceae bacterium]